ncbi:MULTISPECIES: SDR family NAD(P)-dependent oxidoreductase [Pseudonocardia]|uniref:2-(R)-hydroxypropyl-CoM dehydrogenase n=2 Tax=Pseudonocardia TaxID=1847 RepID=A0A1Y2MQH1_PSEAH|nr:MULTISPECIES: SDR family oxidoreductase [Pseudonocardia]OSY36957.1 2-(R)-hydroxypropyl-CoM dehydrogenase [Pseudonocardia autotrophica]TDN75640.1 NAD(P)-dependent dehydrogenase (short-subunit alcohol dehydrogenase family) [Pseudonocardia autotrophica]BBF99612.1 oxidoreductase [Pseudonocardia autotrophica]GEC27674.1 oxidoreductase [Pseudonocardia saturnea]
MNRLAGRVAIVFGGGRAASPEPPDADVAGIGHTTALTYARHGARVAVVDRDTGAAERTAADVRRAGGEALALGADVTDPDQVAAAVAGTVHEFGGIDVVHNNVGTTLLGGPEDITLDQWRGATAVNLDSVFVCCQQTLPHLLARGRGAIVTVSSLASIRWTGYPYPAYAAAKAGVNQLTRSLAVQYADRGIRVNAILAGLVDTPLVYRELAGDRTVDQVRAARDALSPTGRMGRAADVANAALFLASDESAYVNGCLLPVDGGMHARSC